MNSFKNIKCWFIINQHERENPFQTIQEEAVRLFTEFIKDKDYGKGIEQFWFDIYVLEKVNFGQHSDTVWDKMARLSTNVDKHIFDKASEQEKVRLLLNAALISIRFLSQRVPLPKDYKADRLVLEYEEYLSKLSLVLKPDQLTNTIIKHFDTTRFYFHRTTTSEVDKTKILYDLNSIQDFINNAIAGKTFGNSIRAIDFGYEIFDFNGNFAPSFKHTKNYQRYGIKYKNYLYVKQFDYNEVKNLNEKLQYSLLKTKILEGLSDYEKLNKKPKDFNSQAFFSTMEKILNDYETKYVG